MKSSAMPKDGDFALQSAAPLPDEELDEQALRAPGADGDPNTPE